MNPFQHCAQVSALDSPLPEVLCKRHFTPSNTTIFGDARRRKLENGMQAVTSFPVQVFQGSFASASPSDISRQKFKARPIPKSLYHPHQIVSSSHQATVPVEFHLSFKSCSSSYLTPTKHHSASSHFSNVANKAHRSASKPISSPMDIDLHSTKRAREREVYQEHLKELNRRKAAEQQAEAEILAAREREEIKQIRKQAEFRARPMPNFHMVLDWSKRPISDKSTEYTNDNTMMEIE